MGLRYNPFSGSFDFTRSPGSYLDGEVATFADLPLDTAAAPINSAWLVRQASGLYFLTRKPAGIYIRTATGGTDRNADYTYASAFPDVFSDANFTVYDDADSTKNLQFQLSGITTGTTRTLTVPDANGTLPLLETANTYTQNQTLNGTNNVAPNQTAASGSSIMTRALVDARLDFLVPRWHEVPASSFSALTLSGGAASTVFGNAVGCWITTANNIGSHAVVNHLGMALNYLTTGNKGLLWQRPFTIVHPFSLINSTSVCKTWFRLGATNIFHVNPPPAEPNYVSAGWVVEEVTTNLIRFRSYSYSGGAIAYGNEITLGGQYGSAQLAPITFVTTSDGTTIKVGVVNRLGEVVGVSQVAAPTETTEYNPVGSVGLVSDGVNAAGVRATYLVGSVKWSSLSVAL